MQSNVEQRTIFLHIGTEKTGTTTLQTLADLNRPLLAQNGLLYPKVPGERNQMGLTIFAMEPDRVLELHAAMRLHGPNAVSAYRDTFLQKLGAEIDESGLDRVLLSNEHLSSRIKHPAPLLRVIEGLRGLAGTLRVIIYLRPQHELILSAYSTAVKSGNTHEIRLDQGEGNFFFNYDKMLALWESVVGIENIDVRLFDRTKFAGGSLVSDFFAAMGMETPPGLVVPEDRNRALDAETVEYLRIANHGFPRMQNGHIDQDRIRMLALLEDMSDGPRITAPADSLARIDRIFAESNGRVASRYFPHADGPLFPPFEATGATQPTPLSIEKAVEIGVNLWRRRKKTNLAT